MKILGLILLLCEITLTGAVCRLTVNTLHGGSWCSSLNCKLAIYYRADFPVLAVHTPTYNVSSAVRLYGDCRCSCHNQNTNNYLMIRARYSDVAFPIERVERLINLIGLQLFLWGGSGSGKPTISFADDAFSSSGLSVIVINKFARFTLPENCLPKSLLYGYFHENNLTEIPAALLNTKIQKLFIFNGNQIKSIPDSFQKSFMPTEDLQFKNNQIETFPYMIFGLKELFQINLIGNPIKNVILTKSEKEKIEGYKVFNNTIKPFADKCNGTVEEVNPKIGQKFTACIDENRAPRTIVPTNAPATPSNRTNDESSNGMSVPQIVGLSFGGIFVIAALLGVLLFFSKKQKRLGKDFYRLETSQATTKPDEIPVLGTDQELLLLYISGTNILFKNQISKGAYGEVWLAVYNNRNVAIKKLIVPNVGNHLTAELKYEKLVTSVKSFAEEIKLMSKLDHPRVIRLIGCSWTNLYDFFAVTEFMENGDLYEYLQVMKRDIQNGRPTSFSWQKGKLQIAMDIVEGLIYLHSMNPKVIHRDLKSRNVLLDKNIRVKLTDFGTARELDFEDEKTMTGGLGTVYWMAPEILAQERTYTEAVDIYSFGVIMTELDTLEMPYNNFSSRDATESSGNQITYMKIPGLVISGDIRPQCSSQCPQFLSNITASCLAANPSERPTAGSIFYQLENWQRAGFT